MNQLISDKGVYRTAPATPGLLKIDVVAPLIMDITQWNPTIRPYPPNPIIPHTGDTKSLDVCG